MLDWLISKVGLYIAVIVIASTFTAFFAYQQSAMDERALTNTAEHIVEIVEDVNGCPYEVKRTINITEENGFSPTINNKEYTINITPDMVIVSQGRKMYSAHFQEQVVPAQPERIYYNTSGWSAFVDGARWTGDIECGNTLMVERRYVDVSGVGEWRTFVWGA